MYFIDSDVDYHKQFESMMSKDSLNFLELRPPVRCSLQRNGYVPTSHSSFRAKYVDYSRYLAIFGESKLVGEVRVCFKLGRTL